MNFTFNEPRMLYALMAIPLLFLGHAVTTLLKKRTAVKFSHFDLLSKSVMHGAVSNSYVAQVKRRDLLILFGRSLAIICLIFTAAGMNIVYEGEASDFDFVLLIDNSNSMSATDFYPDRMGAAKMAAKQFVDSSDPEARIGIVTFSGLSIVTLKPIVSKSEVKAEIDRIRLSDVGGTDIGGAIVTGANLLEVSDREKALILLTDGQSNVGIMIEDAVHYATKESILIHTIGMGTEKGGYLSDFAMAPFVLDEEQLQYIANTTKGRYTRAADQAQLDDAYLFASKTSVKNISKSLAPYLLFFSIFAFFFEWLFVGFKYRIIP